jgi:excisionase family DNA binding protein
MHTPHSTPHRTTHTPAQAAARAGVSRWTIMRAINSQTLKAHRDNRNAWQITTEDLDAHYPHNVRTVEDAQPESSATTGEKLAAETARADAAERARDQAEADRDRWQAMAEQLAARPRFAWPWQR